VGAAGAGAPPQGNRRVRDTLWLELGAGGDHRGGADALLVVVRGAEDEQSCHGGGGGNRCGDGGVAARAGQGRVGRGKVMLVMESEEGEQLRARVAVHKQAQTQPRASTPVKY